MRSFIHRLPQVFAVVFFLQSGCASDRQWRSKTEHDYNPIALRVFLVDCVKSHPVVDGVNITAARIGEKFRHKYDFCFCFGDWLFRDTDGKPDEFTFTFPWDDDLESAHWVVMRGRRISRDQFLLLSVSRYDNQILAPF